MRLIVAFISQFRCNRNLQKILLILTLFFVAGCHSSGAIAPRGAIAASELHLIKFAVELMLIVVIPVILMALWFAWRYREKNNAKYTPDWKHSTRLEIVWWGIPCIIILILGTVTWKTTHKSDPYKPLESDIKPVTIEVISLDWKWLFIYPDYHIATINYLRLPEKTPIDFKITAAAPMNSFIIPQLGGQIYAMTGMTTQLHLIADTPGIYTGLGANYTGVGFAGMHFDTEVTTETQFEEWTKTIQTKPEKLTSTIFWNNLVPPSTDNPIRYFSQVDEGLFDSIVMHYMMPDTVPDKAHLTYSIQP